MEFYNLQSNIKSTDINLIFPDWEAGNERVVILSPHDDDVFLGAGYILFAALANNAEVHIIIINDGSGGYSDPKLKDEIVELRTNETFNAFKALGMNKEQISRFNIPDFTANHYIGRWLPWKSENSEGISLNLLSIFRKLKTTRLIFPNGYREHIDHTAVSTSAMFDGPQAGDAVMVDYGMPFKISSFLQYSVWAKHSPEDALIHDRDINIRANRAIVVDEEIEQKIQNSLREFKSQIGIINQLLEVRKERQLDQEDRFIELYLEIDPRPKFNYKPYKDLVKNIDNK